MRCRCCDSPEAEFDDYDWYCEDCKEVIDNCIEELEDYEEIQNAFHE